MIEKEEEDNVTTPEQNINTNTYQDNQLNTTEQPEQNIPEIQDKNENSYTEPQQNLNQSEQIPQEISNEPEQIPNEQNSNIIEPEQIKNEPQNILNEPQQISNSFNENLNQSEQKPELKNDFENNKDEVISDTSSKDSSNNFPKYHTQTSTESTKFMAPFEKIIHKEYKKEDEKLKNLREEHKKQKIKKRVNMFYLKDYAVFIFLLLSPVFNFSYLYLPYIIFAMIYVWHIGKLAQKSMKIKYICEIFITGYSCYLLGFKIICLILISKNNLIVTGNKEIFLDLGIRSLYDENSNFCFYMTFLSEILMIIINGIGLLISFKCRILKEADIKYKTTATLTLKKLITAAYLHIIVYSLFDISFLSLLYILLFQYLMLIASVQIDEKKINVILKYVVNFLIIILCIQIVLISVLNIPRLQENILYGNVVTSDSENDVKVYSIFTQIGIIYSYRDNWKSILKSFFGYFLLIVILNYLIFINFELNYGKNIISEKEYKKLSKKKQKEYLSNEMIELKDINSKKTGPKKESVKTKTIKKNALTIIFNLFGFFNSHPLMNYEIERMVSIFWIYYYRNLYSLVIFICIFFSFFFSELKSNKTLTLYLLLPMLILTIVSFHISNIDGYFESIKETSLLYDRLAIRKYSHFYLEHILGHVFYLFVMFLVDSFYSLKSKDLENQNLKSTKSNLVNNELSDQMIGNENGLLDDDLYEDKSDDGNLEYNTSSENSSERSSSVSFVPKKVEKNDNYNFLDYKFYELLLKIMFDNMDKITLAVMFCVSVTTVNLTHVVLVFIFAIEILLPKKMHYLYLILLIIFQLLYLLEFLVDLLKIKLFDWFNEHQDLLQLLIVYKGNLYKTDIEWIIYFVIYCVYFQYRAHKNEYIKNLVHNKKICLRHYVTNKFKQMPLLRDNILFLGNLSLHLYLWFLVFLFVFFSCYFEISVIFCIKLIIFFISIFSFIRTIQKDYSKNSTNNFRCIYGYNYFFLIFTCLNTFAVYLYQFLCLNLFSIKKKIEDSENPIIKNLPTIGFTVYSDDNLFYNFLPHFMTAVISVLITNRMKDFLEQIKENFRENNKKLRREKTIIMENIKNIENEIEEIKEEKNEFIQEKKYSDKYNSNIEEIKIKSRRIFKINIILLYTKVYWLLLFLSLGIIFSTYDLSFSILLYIIVFGFLFIKMYHHIISRMRNYLKEKSYFISKVIRFKVVEQPKHQKINRYYRILTFNCLFFLSLLYLVLLYFYGLFDLFQHGCNPDYYRGCDPSFSPIFKPTNVTNGTNVTENSKEDIIKSISFLFGIYINMRKENIITIAWIHLVFSGLICLDIYNQKLENTYLSIFNDLRSELQKLINENNALEKYSDLSDVNILIKIGLTLAGINLSSNEKTDENKTANRKFRPALRDQFFAKNTIQEAEDKSESVENMIKEYKKNPKFKFLNNKMINKFLTMIKSSNDNEQKLALGNSKEKIYRFFKKLLEEIIIFLLICISLGKLNIWTFIYLFFTVCLILTKKTMWKFYCLSCFIYFAILLQSFLYLSNIAEETSVRDYDDIFAVLENRLSIPWYKKCMGLKTAFFLGLGVCEQQVKLIWLEFMQIAAIFLYLDSFSYSIYQETVNKGSSSLIGQKLNFENLNMSNSSIRRVKNMSEEDFKNCKECLDSFGLNIGNTLKEFLKNIKNNKESETNLPTVPEGVNRSTDKELAKVFDMGNIQNPELKNLMKLRLETKKLKKSLEDKNTSQYKPIPNYILVFQEILYMHFHCFILIFIILTSIMLAGPLSIFYVAISFYYLIKSDSLFLGTKYSYPKMLKKLLIVVVLIDITIQAIYQTPYFSQSEDSPWYDLCKAIGLIKVIDFKKDENNKDTVVIDQEVEVFGKALIYFFMSVQILIYDSKSFQRYYLVYLLSFKYDINKLSKINAFTYNNNRAKIFNKSLEIRQRTDKTMDDLKDILINTKLNEENDEPIKKHSTKSFSSKHLIRIKERKNTEEEELKKKEEEKKKNEDNGEFLEVEEVKERIQKVIYSGFLMQTYLWLHKNSASYKNIELDARPDFDIDTIKGDTQIKSVIENDLNRGLNILDLTKIDKNKMKHILLIIETGFDKSKKQIYEQKKQEEEKSKETLQKFAAGLKKGKLLAKLVTKNFGNTGSISNDDNEDYLSKCKERLEKQQLEDKLKKEQEEYKENQFFDFLETKLFKNYLKKSYLFVNSLLFLQSFFIKNASWLCYIAMIINHMVSGSIVTLVYPFSIFCYALLDYPRPKKEYWILCLYYTLVIVCVKSAIQLKLIVYIIGEQNLKKLLDNLTNYRLGFKYFDSTFHRAFVKYIIFDILVILWILINRNLLISEGLWEKRENEIENIYQASERIAIYGNKRHSSKIEAIKDLLLKYLISSNELLASRKRDNSNSKKVAKYKFPFLTTSNPDPIYNEAKRNFFKKIFTTNRNEKPGNNFYTEYTIVMFLLCMYILVFYTKMDQDNTYGNVDYDTTQISGAMVIVLILHILMLTYDRIIYVSQNRENINYEYIFYRKNPRNGQGELLTEQETNILKSHICEEIDEDKFTVIPTDIIEKLKKKYNIIFIQRENFNKPLLHKFILHIFTVIFSHLLIFFYFPIKGNQNLGVKNFCHQFDKTCTDNEFTSNIFMIIFYILYVLYLIFSALQIKSGFYDIKRKSFFKQKGDELFSNMFSLFSAIPFLYEIRNTIDWTFTSTCLTLFQWNKFEAIYDSIFDTYCNKVEWDERPVGQKVSKELKLGMGASLSLVLILILVVPLILFSSLNPTNKLNNITAGKLNVYLTFNYENGVIKNYNLYENTRADSISQMSLNESLWEKYHYSESISTRNFNKKQVQRMLFSETSDRNWDLAIPHINTLIKLLNITEDHDLSSIELTCDLELSRPLPAEAQTLSYSFSIPMFSQGDSLNSSSAKNVDELRNGLANCKNANITFNDAYTPALRLTSGSDVDVIEDEDYFESKNVSLGFQGCEKDNNNSVNYFNSYFTFGIKEADNTTQSVEFHTFSDQISETTQGYSVLTFYISFVLLAGTYIREYLQSEPVTIMFDEMPHPKKIVDLCEGVKIARYGYDFKNEEFLYTILIELLRSPDYLKLITDSSLDHFEQREKIEVTDD